MADLASSARSASNSSAMEGLARFGLAARAFVYLVIGWLAVQIALGHGHQQANQRGAIAAVAQHPFGKMLLWVLAAGFAGYAVWRLSEAAFGTAAEGRETGPRLQSLVRGVIYAALCVSTVSFLLGSAQQGQAQQQETTTAKLMKHTAGRVLVGLLGVVVIVVGIAMIVEGARRKFEKQLRMGELHGATRTAVVRLGMVGTIARGAVFAVAGLLTVDAAVTFDARKSTGLDGALRTLADRPYGPWLLGVLALGLIAFGVYGFAAARWAKV
jgi:hypothetical protein